MTNNWVKIYSSPHAHEIEMVKSVLQEKEIESVEISKKDSMYLFGEIELYVSKENAFSATQVINNVLNS